MSLTLSIRSRSLEGVLVAEYGALIRYSQRLTSNGPEAMDLVQMVCVRVLARRAQHDCPDNPSAWLRTILLRLFIDSRRRARWEIPTDILLLEPLRNEDAPQGETCGTAVEDVRALLGTLPVHYRIAYELFTFEHCSYDRIAGRLGISSKTVATRINRARSKLRGLLEERTRTDHRPATASSGSTTLGLVDARVPS